MDIQSLVKRARRGDTEAFGQIYDIYVDTIYRFVSFRVGRREDAEDITEQIFMNMFTAIQRYNDMGIPFEAWMYRIARNKIIDYYRAHKSYIDLDDMAQVPDNQPTPEEILEETYTRQMLFDALGKIPDQYKEILILKFIEDKDNEEISVILEKPVSHIRVLQHRALLALKKSIHI